MVNRILPSIGRLRLIPFVLLLPAILLSGCMYRAQMESRAENPAYLREEIARVQGAVDEYRKQRTVLPIKNSDEATPIYEKYKVDLKKLANLHLLSSIPQNAFENGGNYYYVLVNPEEAPEVKLMDIAAIQTAADLERKLHDYATDNGGKPPFGAKLAEEFYAIDYQALNLKPVQFKSLYSGNYLPLVLHASGRTAIDYSLDIMKALENQGISSPDPSWDLREALVSDSFFVPVHSYPYLWRDGQPVITAREPSPQ
jgi:hypothetical protein